MPIDPALEKRLQSMLYLSALTYRHYADWIPGTLHDDGLRRVVEKGLADLENSAWRKEKKLGNALEDSWILAWGPESYRAPLSVFDDAMMFVVRDAKQPNRYVVAVRGTNPVSVFDWVLGDLWVSHPVPWPHGRPGKARISMSTAIGLSILQNMRATRPRDPSLRDVWERVERAARRARGAANGAVESARQILSRVAARSSASGTEARTQLLKMASDDDLIARVRQLQEHLAAVRGDADAAVEDVDGAVHHALFGVLDAAVKGSANDGSSLIDFLNGAAQTSSAALEITVTGHSKGGALAPALALWLAETIDEDEAKIDCVAFAGPSPGNRAFADRFHAAFQDRFERVVNALDIVPCAWEPGTLRTIPALYPSGPRCPGGLAQLVTSIADQVKDLDYAHLGDRLTKLTPAVNGKLAVFTAQMIHQHLDGYFLGLNLPTLTTQDFFDPIPIS